MKRIYILLVVLVIVSMLTACGSKDQKAEPANTNDPAKINYEYDGALSSRLLLALGTLKLAETSVPITSDQAPQMLMLWQALESLTQSGTSAEAEVNAILTQIDQEFTTDQAVAINAMSLTQEDLQTWAQTNGITLGSGASTGLGMGQGSGLSPEARATKRAENGMVGDAATGEGGLSSAITDALITYLKNIK